MRSLIGPLVSGQTESVGGDRTGHGLLIDAGDNPARVAGLRYEQIADRGNVDTEYFHSLPTCAGLFAALGAALDIAIAAGINPAPAVVPNAELWLLIAVAVMAGSAVNSLNTPATVNVPAPTMR